MYKNNTKHFTRGGQITLHNLRMWVQISNKIALLALIIFIVVVSSISLVKVTPYERYVFGEYAWSQVLPFFNSEIKTNFMNSNGRSVTVSYQDLANSKMIKNITHKVCVKIIYASCIGAIFSLFSVFGISFWLRKRGQIQTENKLIKGDTLQTKEITKKIIIKNNQNSDLILANLPLIRHKEKAHILFHGSTGTGKSSAIKELLDQIRIRGDRAIIFDKSCNFLEEFYQPRKDVLLNPLDKRGATWDLWLECRDSVDFNSLATAFIATPLSNSDPFWVNAARMIFASSAFEMRNNPDRNLFKLLQYLMTSDMEVLENHLKGTVAETLVSGKTEKTTQSIKSVLATYLNSLKYVSEGKNPFSIRNWIQNEKAKNWLFITSVADRHETLKPLITAWLDIAVNALMSLSPDENRRIWLILDELTSLQQLPYLTQTLSEARKFGGCVVIGIQNYAQLQKLYGVSGAKEISSLLNTRFNFRQPDEEMAKWSAGNFGETVVEEVHEGISYGANTLRDGISINRVETRKPLLSHSEIMSLADFFAYVRLPGNYPVCRVGFPHIKRARAQEGLVMRHIDEDEMKNIDCLLDVCGTPDIAMSKHEKLLKAYDAYDKQPEQLFDL